jgi:hypothetical protein
MDGDVQRGESVQSFLQRTYLGHSVGVGSQAGAAMARRATSQTRNHQGPRVRE